ncbi:hypothetical protein HHK36_000703 [Tetracentron sinense]|uniref:Myb/SANT-like DNA-binding domain-containing protein n=1 Tax=Tetracentron sinense TaxID=13715 RepID=A0A834ZS15_TETSI|nr:hypothetical protein HHK36_000703 [Tetracentron sinense]
MKRSGDKEVRGRPAELRWKWVEDYCCRNGCLRSQNQCNDKWDNLMRDYKKVYEALVEVVERKGAQRVIGSSGSNMGVVMEGSMGIVYPSLPPPFQHPSSNPIPPLPPPSPDLTSLPTIHQPREGEEREPAGLVSSKSTSHEVDSAISKSASIIAEALQACEEKEVKRHRDLLSLQERRLQIEKSRTEINREAINVIDKLVKEHDHVFPMLQEDILSGNLVWNLKHLQHFDPY